jgi:putative FmdB family regulatory protein
VPTYQYACTDCGNDLEVVQKFSDDPLTECPVCHGRLRKVFYPVGVVFKGSGFYRTDSRKQDKEPAAAGSANGAAAKADGATKATDATGSKSAKDAAKKPAGATSAG